MRINLRGLSSLLLGLALLGLGCKKVAEAPTSLSYANNPASYMVGTAITPNTPTHSGGDIDSYSVSPALPIGLSLNATSGVISGTPTATAATATYTITATNTAGSTSASLSITVSGVLTITAQPMDQSILVGLTATFNVTVTGTGTLSYQWLKDGGAISGATSASYTTPAATLTDSGSKFSVQVSDSAGGSLTSNIATLTVLDSGPGTFTLTGSMATARIYHTATLLNTGKVLVVGGSNGSSALPSAELYDSAIESFTTTGSLITARRNHAATLLADGKVLITGGTVGSGTSLITLATAEVYDPATGLFTATAGSLAAARSDHTATLLPNGKVLIVSGRNGAAYQKSAEVYDPTARTFTSTTLLPLAARATHTATLLGNGKVLIAGGYSGSALVSAELYDPAAGSFTATGSLTTARAEQTATLLSTGKVLLVGGAATLAAELYDPTVGTFAATGGLVTARDHWHTAALLANGKVLIAGGVTGSGSATPLSVAELYDPLSGAFTASGNMTTARELHTATSLPNGKVLLAGGSAGFFFSSAELYF